MAWPHPLSGGGDTPTLGGARGAGRWLQRSPVSGNAWSPYGDISVLERTSLPNTSPSQTGEAPTSDVCCGRALVASRRLDHFSGRGGLQGTWHKPGRTDANPGICS